MTKKYETKISYGLLITISLLFFMPVIFVLFNKGFTEELYVLIGILMPIYALILQTFIRTDYIIENEKLKIKCGFLINIKINISEIKEIRKTSSLISSPAPSFDRIEIKYGKYNEVIISPKDKFTFAKDLTMINPTIKNNITEN